MKQTSSGPGTEDPSRVVGLRSKHLDYYLELAKTAEAEVRGPEQAHWYKTLDAEYDNLVSAFEWSAEQKDENAALTLALAIYLAWYKRGDEWPAREYLERALALEGPPSGIRARASRYLGSIVWGQGQPGSHQLVRTSLDIAREGGDLKEISASLKTLGMRYLHEEGGFEASVALAEDALETAKRSGDESTIADAMWLVADKVRLGSDTTRANELREDALATYRKLGDKELIAWMLYGLAWTEPDIDRALSYGEESLAIGRELENDVLIICVIDVIGWLKWRAGDLDGAREIFQAGLEEFQHPGIKWPIWWAVSWMLNDIGQIDLVQGNYDQVLALGEKALEISRRHNDRPAEVWVHAQLAAAAQTVGDPSRALSLAKEGVAVARSIGRQQFLSNALFSLGEIQLVQGDIGSARKSLEQSLEIRRIARSPVSIMYSLVRLAEVVSREEDLDVAERLAQEAVELSDSEHVWDIYHVRAQIALAHVYRLKDALREAASLNGTALKKAHELRQGWLVLASLYESAAIAMLGGDPERGAKLVGAAERVSADRREVQSVFDRTIADEVVEQLRNSLGQGTFDQLRAEGYEMQEASAVELALGS